MSAELLALYDTDKAAFILAVADLRERRAKAATRGQWYQLSGSVYVKLPTGRLEHVSYGPVRAEPNRQQPELDAEHIAAEANPEHALAAVRRWRGVVKRHKRDTGYGDDRMGCEVCGDEYSGYGWPCADLTETADEARAYLGGAS